MLAKSVTEAARFIAERGVGPILVRFITQVAARFGVVVTQKVGAQALPVIGALGGAAVNYAFIEHFQDVARGHFTVCRLERVYGKNLVRTEYDRVAKDHWYPTAVTLILTVDFKVRCAPNSGRSAAAPRTVAMGQHATLHAWFDTKEVDSWGGLIAQFFCWWPSWDLMLLYARHVMADDLPGVALVKCYCVGAAFGRGMVAGVMIGATLGIGGALLLAVIL